MRQWQVAGDSPSPWLTSTGANRIRCTSTFFNRSRDEHHRQHFVRLSLLCCLFFSHLITPARFLHQVFAGRKTFDALHTFTSCIISAMNAPTTAASLAPAKPRPYKRFVTSAFHIRFVHAAALSLFICWDQAVLLSPRYGMFRTIATRRCANLVDVFWSWFPIGPAGLRALLYFFALILIFILQVATVTVGKPTPTSPFQQLRRSLFSSSTFKTCFWYICSALWFTEIYIWSSPSMSWVTRGDAGTSDKLNERPIYLRACFVMLAVFQSIKHVYFAHATIQLPISNAPTAQDKDRRTHPIPDTYTFFRSQAPGILIRSAIGAVVTTAVCPFIYSFMLRRTLWRFHLFFAGLFFNVARSSARPIGIPPVLGTMLTTIVVGFWLSLSWELCALSLIAYFKKPPVKNDMTWTAVGKDPNGSLLNGLKLRPGILKTFAFWELVIITQNHQERRRAIFSDIDRPTGSVWGQMLTEALKVVKQIDERIQPTPVADPTAAQQPAATLPKILRPQSEAARTQEEKTLLALKSNKNERARQRLLNIADDKLKQLGSHPDPIRVPELPDTSTAVWKFTSSFSWFFGSSPAAKINALVLGTPHSNAATIVDATEAITRMLIASLQDDAYGKAMAGVPEAVKQFAKTIALIETLIEQNPTHGGIDDVEIVLNRLKAGLSELLSAFQMFLSDSGLGIADLKAAKKSSGQLALEQEEQKRFKEVPRQRELLDFEDAPPREEVPTESWREWSRPKKASKLFPQYNPNPRSRRQPSGENAANGVATRTSRPREMEQVR